MRDADATFRLGYRPELDGLRAIAIVAVLLYHFGCLPGGFLGVDLFFVLSGFLITAILAQEWDRTGAISLRKFYLRRILRLWPAFFALLLGLLAIHYFLLPDRLGGYLREMIVAGCYIANWPTFHQVGMPLLGHTWSLSVEEQFYVLWPILLFGMLRAGWPRRRILFAVAAGILLSCAWRHYLYAFRSPTPEGKAEIIARLYFGLDARADALLMGCLVGLLAAWNRLPALRALTPLAIVSTIVLAYMARYSGYDHGQFYRGLFTLVAFMNAAILMRLLAAPSIATRLLSWPPLVFVGRLSYSLYLVHIPVLAWLRPDAHELIGTLLAVGATFLLAVFSHFCVERPFLRWKDRCRASETDAGPVIAARRAA